MRHVDAQMHAVPTLEEVQIPRKNGAARIDKANEGTEHLLPAYVDRRHRPDMSDPSCQVAANLRRARAKQRANRDACQQKRGRG